MTRPILLASVLLFLLVSSYAMAQATAEAAVGHSAAGTAAAKTGSSLGNAFGKAFDKSSDKLSNAMQSPAQAAATSTTTSSPIPNAAPDASTSQPALPADASIVQFSVWDVGTQCPAPKDWKHKDAVAPNNNNVTVCSLHASAKPFPKTKYKPVVEIKF